MGDQAQRQSLEISSFGEVGPWNLFSSMILLLANGSGPKICVRILEKERLGGEKGHRACPRSQPGAPESERSPA